MGNHTFTYLVSSDPELHWAYCTCGHRTDKYLTGQLVEDEVIRHHQHIERVRAHLSTATPSLKQQRNYFREKASDPKGDPKWTPIWAQMADELDHRLNDTPHTFEQLNLNLIEVEES